MTEKEAMESPLHEVWGYFKSNHGKFWVFENNPPKTARRRQVEKWGTVLPMLRRVLLGRCDNHRFKHEEPDPGINPAVWVEWHMEMSAYHAFWAWEIEQRKKESGEQNP